MNFSFLGKGMVIGFSIAAPVGPIGVLCIRRSLADGARTGLATGWVPRPPTPLTVRSRDSA